MDSSSDLLSIALLSHVASPRAPTGAERSLSLLAEGLRARGHRVSLVAPGPPGNAASLRDAGLDLQAIRCRACWLIYFDARPWPVALAKWLRFDWPQPAVSRMTDHIRRWKAGVVHVNCLPHLRGARAAAAAGVPLVWHVREILPPGRRRRWFAEQLRRRAKVVVGVSQAVGDWLREEGLEDRLRVIPNGVDPGGSLLEGQGSARTALGIPEEGVAIGLFGQLVPHKGAIEFVEAARLASAEVSELRFIVAGSGPKEFRARVARAIEESGLVPRFHLLPPQPDGERLIRACEVVCLATRTPDPFPRAVLDAMAAGKPVAAFRSGGTGEMVCHGETGLLVEPGDVEGLGRAFVTLGRDAHLRASYGRAGAGRAASEFSLERHPDRMESLFREVGR